MSQRPTCHIHPHDDYDDAHDHDHDDHDDHDVVVGVSDPHVTKIETELFKITLFPRNKQTKKSGKSQTARRSPLLSFFSIMMQNEIVYRRRIYL